MENSNLSITNNTPNEVDVLTVKKITLNGIEYEPQFESEGMKIPTVVFTGYQNKVIYIQIPKNEIIKCLKEYLPELIDSSVIKNG